MSEKDPVPETNARRRALKALLTGGGAIAAMQALPARCPGLGHRPNRRTSSAS